MEKKHVHGLFSRWDKYKNTHSGEHTHTRASVCIHIQTWRTEYIWSFFFLYNVTPHLLNVVQLYILVLSILIMSKTCTHLKQQGLSIDIDGISFEIWHSAKLFVARVLQAGPAWVSLPEDYSENNMGGICFAASDWIRIDFAAIGPGDYRVPGLV